MKRFISMLLCAAIGLSLAACAESPAGSAEPTEIQKKPVPEYDYPEINDTLTWDKINAFPIKSSSMSIEELRQLCVDFFRFTKTVLWTADNSFEYVRNADGATDSVSMGLIYGGLPYITLGTGNVYRLMDYMYEGTSVVDMEMVSQNPSLFGSQCSVGSYWAWGRVINSAKHEYTESMVEPNGFIPVGPYEYTVPSTGKFSKDNRTTAICQQNGEQVMYQSYALLQPADGMVRFAAGGHVIMCATEPHVQYVAGTEQIDGKNSYLTIIDQTQTGGWQYGSNEQGDKYTYMNSVDARWTFAQLYEKGYLPFTFAEFLGTDPVEETECSFSFTGDTITVSELFSSKVTANYGIADVYAIVKASNGTEIYRHAVRATLPATMELELVEEADNVVSWGKLDVSKGEYTVEIQCQLATGERPTIYTGTLVP